MTDKNNPSMQESITCCSNNNCSGSFCDKHYTYDWFQDLPAFETDKQFNIVEISFNYGTEKGFYRNSKHLTLKKGEFVIVKDDVGYDIGKVSLMGLLAHLQMKKKKISKSNEQIRDIIRKATEKDLLAWNEVKKMEYSTMVKAKSISLKMGLEMKIGDVRYHGDKKKATFYYTADDRVDFRELIKEFAKEFKVKIKMHQIGSRQEAGRIGGIGECGRELCCCSYLTDFVSVTTTTARNQNLTINQTKLSGQCGRLKCCLNYEAANYLEAKKEVPKKAEVLKTQKGIATLQKTDIFKKVLWYSYENETKLYPLSFKNVEEVLKMNKKGEKVLRLEDIQLTEKDEPVDFDNEVGHISLSNLEKKEKKRRKKGKNKYNKR